MNISSTTINIVYKSFLSFEIFVQLAALFLSAAFIATFTRMKSLHIHLIIVFVSCIIGFCFTSFVRLWQLYAVLFQGKNILAPEIMIIANLRQIGMYAEGLHVLLIALERILATFRVNTYEKERYLLPLFGMIVFTWAFAVAFFHVEISSFTDVFFYLFVDIFSIGIMLWVKRRNISYYKKYRGNLGVTRGYQVRENVRTSKFLHKTFLAYALCILFAILSYMAYYYFAKNNYPLSAKIAGFGFDILTALAPVFVVTTVFLTNEKLRERFHLPKSGGKVHDKATGIVIQGNSSKLLNLEGKNVKIQTCEETEVYFKQLGEAWK